MLVHTPNGNIPIVAKYLQQHGLLLDHPTSSWEPDRVSQLLYLNPHNPPPGGHARMLNASARPGYPGPAGRYFTQQVSGKSVEVQRNQVDEVFKIIRNGDELEETEASELTITLFCSLSHSILREQHLRSRRRYIHTRRKHSLSFWNASEKKDLQTARTLHFGKSEGMQFPVRKRGSMWSHNEKLLKSLQISGARCLQMM